MENVLKGKLSKLQNKNTKQIKIFKKMYGEYIEELKMYSPRLKEEDFTYEEMMKVMFNKCTDIYFVKIEEKIIGFVIIGIQYPERHPDLNFSICEFYILPEHRRQGIGENIIKQILKNYKGLMSLYVLKENITAKLFWNDVARKFKFEDKTDRYTNLCTPDDCIFKVYDIPNKKNKKYKNKNK